MPRLWTSFPDNPLSSRSLFIQCSHLFFGLPLALRPDTSILLTLINVKTSCNVSHYSQFICCVVLLMVLFRFSLIVRKLYLFDLSVHPSCILLNTSVITVNLSVVLYCSWFCSGSV
ncbi:hypothetical protein WDU94_012110 [Cyamophila willieti]